MVRVEVIRSSREAIVRPVRCSRRPCQSSAAFAAVRNARDAPPADRPAGPSRRRRPVPSLPRAARRCRAAGRSAPDGRECARRAPASPVSWLAPPVRTTRPRGSAANGEVASRSRTISRISSTRGLMMRDELRARNELRGLALVVVDRRHRDHVALVRCAGEHAAVERLDSLGIGDAGVEAAGEVHGDVAAAEREAVGMDEAAGGEHRRWWWCRRPCR